MKTLLLLRHAKSGGKGLGIPDHDRPLNSRGRRDAPRMGRLMREEGLLPDLVLSSTARRARATTVPAVEHSGYDGVVEYVEDLYHASADEMIDLLRAQDDRHRCIMLVGHNPGMEELLDELAGADEHFPTGAIALINLRIERWGDLDGRTESTLEQLWRPRELT